MSKASLIKTFTVLLAAMFLMVQGISQAHATSNGGLDHSHDGIACDVALVAAEQIIATPPPPFTTPFRPAVLANWQIVCNTDAPRTFDSRAPPPRGPPTH